MIAQKIEDIDNQSKQVVFIFSSHNFLQEIWKTCLFGSLGELKNLWKHIPCGISHSPKLPLMLLYLNWNTVCVFYFLSRIQFGKSTKEYINKTYFQTITNDLVLFLHCLNQKVTIFKLTPSWWNQHKFHHLLSCCFDQQYLFLEN